MSYYIAVLKNYAGFGGRARRKEYWMFILFNMIFAFCLGFVDGLLNLGFLYFLYSLAVFIPSIAVGIRRMHDVDKSGWFLLIPIYNLVLACTAGSTGENRFGQDPKM